MKRRHLNPAPPRAAEPGDHAAQRRSTLRLLLVGVATNMVGCVAHYLFIAPPRLGGAMARPTVEMRQVELPESPGKP